MNEIFNSDWRKKLGSMQQEAYVREIEYQEGRAAGLKAYQVKAGQLAFTVAEDKCLDITELSWKGNSFQFISKPGLQNRQHYDSSGFEAQRSIMGGMFFTCGTDNVGTPSVNSEKPLPMHGSLRSTPAEHACADAFWEDGEYKIILSGEMRQASLFGGDMVLRRKIETKLGSRSIHIHDEFENQAYRDAPFMLLYHFNIGYPLLDTDTEIKIPSKTAVLRGEERQTTLSWNQISVPVDGMEEEVFYHELEADKDGCTSVSAYNKNIHAGLELRFCKEKLPRFTEWKSMASGDYAMGFEPCNCNVKGLEWERKNGTLPMLKAGEKKTVDLELNIME